MSEDLHTLYAQELIARYQDAIAVALEAGGRKPGDDVEMFEREMLRRMQHCER